MTRRIRTFALPGCGTAALLAMMVGACTNNQPALVFGPPTITNALPELQILEPVASFSISQGDRFNIRWTDSDPDSAAQISYSLVEIDTGFEIVVVSNIEENDSLAPDEFTVSTSLIPFGDYNLKGTISDGLNQPVVTFAMTEGSTTQRVVINVGEPGTRPENLPPRVAVRQPSFNQGVAQEDTLIIVVAPTTNIFDTTTPYDPDDDTTLFVLLDLDDNPENDDPRTPDPDEIIVLRELDITAGDPTPQTFTIPIDLGTIPPRTDGSPYYVRATIVDPGNEPVHDYADGTIQILRSATGIVDVSLIGKTLAGVQWIGFNPGSRLGNDMVGVGDFDGDGIDDFILVAQFGNPRNFGNIGEAYLIYGLNNIRFGGQINVNSVSSTISGAIFEAPPNRLAHLHVQPEFNPRGITSVGSVSDLTGDGRPELLIGMGLTDGMYQGRDDDPGDNPDVIRVNLTMRQELLTVTQNGVPDETFDDDFQGTFDTYVSRTQPTSSFSTANQAMFGAASEVQGDQFPIVGFDLQQFFGFFFANPDNVNGLSATLVLPIATSTPITSDSFTVNRLISTPPANVSYNDFAFDGMPGPTETTEYETDALDFNVNLFEQEVRVDVSDTLQKILDGEIGTFFPTWIVVPQEAVSGSFFTSENPDEENRPQLIINFAFTQDEFSQNVSCYPDSQPNNKSDTVPQFVTRPPHDSIYESSGVVVFVGSENRDNDGPSSADRLENTSIATELVGQAQPPLGISPTDGLVDRPTSGVPEPSGDIDVKAGTEDEANRTRGCRFSMGWYDYINDSLEGGQRGRANPRADYFGEHVAPLVDVDNDGLPEIIISAPRSELYQQGIRDTGGSCIADFPTRGDYHNCESTQYQGSIVVLPSADYSTAGVASNAGGAQSLPSQNGAFGLGTCSGMRRGRGGTTSIRGGFTVFAEAADDFLGGAEDAGDVNLDGVHDIVCGAPLNDNPNGQNNTGALYIIYGRTPVGDVRLVNLDNPGARPPTIRIRGEKEGDEVGAVQTSGLDINGDRIDDVFFGAPKADFAIRQDQCGDLDGNGVVDATDLDVDVFNTCRANLGSEVFLDDGCKPFDFDNDRDIDGDDRDVLDCLIGGFANCCPVDNGYVGVVFGDVNLDGDRTISQVGTANLPGIKFFGANPGDRAGSDVVSAGDFNRDGFGDLLIAAPGVRFIDNNGRERMGVAYLIFGGTHLNGNLSFSLSQVGTDQLPGVVFWSPFVAGRPDEAPIDHVGALGDINNDGFDDVALGVTRADFVDTSLPQGSGGSGSDPSIGRRPDDGSIYLIYGNNTGSNR